MALKDTAQLAREVAKVLVDNGLQGAANPLGDIKSVLSREEFLIFCKLLSFESQKHISKQISEWGNEHLHDA